MFCPHKNSYLQLACSVSPKTINRSVEAARARLTGADAEPLSRLRRLTSAQPSLFAPCVDITRARLGFGRIGLRKLNRELHHRDRLVQLQALHTLLDQAARPESASFLIRVHVVYRLVDLMLHGDPVVREKVCVVLDGLANIFEGRKAIQSRKLIFQNLMRLITTDPKKEVRYAAATTLRSLSRDRCAVEVFEGLDGVVAELLGAVRRDHVGIALLHLETLENMIEWEQEKALECGAFEMAVALLRVREARVAAAGLRVLRQLLKHAEGRRLADESDLVFTLHDLLSHASVEVVTAAAGALQYATLTTRSKWRARERCDRLTRRLVELCRRANAPPLQLFCLRTLVSLCDLPDVRAYVRANLADSIEEIRFRTHEQWDGTSETTSFGLQTGHNYRTLCIENVETIRNDYESEEAVDVHSYLGTLAALKNQLIKAINWKPYP